MRALGLDLGTRRVGVAVCDSAGAVATPVTTLTRRGGRGLYDAALEEVLRERDAEIVVVGLPRSLDGSEGPAARRARAEMRRLRRTLGVPVVAWDERLTTVMAERSLAGRRLSGRKRRQVVDSVAAAAILQSWLDAGMPGA